MSLSVYAHIPYCLQRCRYCDFTTFEQSTILPPDRYVAQLLQEIRRRHHLWAGRGIRTLYFGGGTPSLIDAKLIVAIRRELENVGLMIEADAEITIEINPATLDERKLDQYREAGINRFSVGAQTFDDQLLTSCGRRHSAADTRSTLRLLANENYSFDLLFALPGQTLAGVERDLIEVAEFSPPHLSAYCLTVPDGHPMATGRAPEDEQIAMFDLIEARSRDIGLHKYEISNFARPGLESRHNQSYWSDVAFWGLGVSAHSYDPGLGPNGTRFWNPRALREYGQQVERTGTTFAEILPPDQLEGLAVHESLTDFAHMFLRRRAGLRMDALQLKFGSRVAALVAEKLRDSERRGHVEVVGGAHRLTQVGTLISNRVFENLTFLAGDLAPVALTGNPRDSYCAV